MEALIEGTFILEKMPGKGGWTFIKLPAVSADYKGKWGTVKVSGSIDDYKLGSIGLMPIKNGGLFLPVKAEIRKSIGKQEGDWVKIVFYPDEPSIPIATPEDLLLCLQDEPDAYQTYLSYTQAEQEAFLNWIAEASHDDARVQRIVRTIDMLLNKQKR